MVSSTSVRLDQTFETLSDEQRRHVLYYLAESSDGTATVGELVELLGGDSFRTEVRLRHVHIPHLRSTAVVDYDGRTETVRYQGSSLLERILDCCFEEYSPCVE